MQVQEHLSGLHLYTNQLHPIDSPIPALEETLVLFAAHLTFNLNPQSIKLYLYRVRNLHRVRNLNIENGLSVTLQDCL